MPCGACSATMGVMTMHMIGAVLAGGSSTRMGRPKAALRIGDETLLERAVGVLGSRLDEIIVCGGQDAPRGTVLVPDVVDSAGPLAGIEAALEYGEGRDVLVLAVDLPLVTSEVIDRLLVPLLAGQVRVARGSGRVQPLLGGYSADLLGLVRAHRMSDDRSVMGLIGAVPHLTLIDVDPDSLVNINTPADLGIVKSSRTTP